MDRRRQRAGAWGPAFSFDWPDVDAMQVCMYKTVGSAYHAVMRRRTVPAGGSLTFRYAFLPFTGFGTLDGMNGDLAGGVLVGAKANYLEDVAAAELKPGCHRADPRVRWPAVRRGAAGPAPLRAPGGRADGAGRNQARRGEGRRDRHAGRPIEAGRRGPVRPDRDGRGRRRRASAWKSRWRWARRNWPTAPRRRPARNAARATAAWGSVRPR